MTKSYHHISWDSGEFAYQFLPVIIDVFRLSNVTFYAKGEDKCKVLSTLFKLEVLNLECFGCPAMTELILQNMTCEAYPITHANTIHCAHLKALTLDRWMRSNLYNV